MKNQRIEAYLALAAAPAVIGGIATADVHHYDGPAISVTTNGLPEFPDRDIAAYASFSVGGGGLYMNVDLGVAAYKTGIPVVEYGRAAAVNGWFSSSTGGGFLTRKGGSGIGYEKPNAQRFSYSQKMADPKTNRPKDGELKIGGSVDGEYGNKGEFNQEFGEARGYIGFLIENDGSAGFGWMDIGYDFSSNTLTMHDWAFNDDGGLYAGHLTPPVPGPAGLLALAAGAAGIRRKRNRVA